MTDRSFVAFDHQAVADSLHDLRTAGRMQPTNAFPLPRDLVEAMRVQSALAEREGVAGQAWKVALSPDEHAVVAPLHPYVETLSREAELPYLPGMKFEVEIALRLGRDLPIKQDPYSREEIYEAIATAHLGAELLSSAVEESGKLSFALYLGDRIGNRGYVLGPVVPKTLIDSVGGTSLTVVQGDSVIHEGTARHPVGDVLAWLVAHANDKSRTNGALASGSVITTGALSGAMPLPGPGKVDILLAGQFALSVTLVE